MFMNGKELKMEIKQLEYFAAAVEYGSLNRAAEKLYTTQPNVSRVLNSLEKELHVTLLERSNKGIKMTPQGEELYGRKGRGSGNGPQGL